MSYLIGIDGGGTRTTVAIADQEGRELLRHVGAAGLIDPRHPAGSAECLVTLVREAVSQAGLEAPAAALCAGLAGAGSEAERGTVDRMLAASGVAERVLVCSDGAIALEGAFGEQAGILLIAGTGSVAYGRGEDGRVQRCGGWGLIVGDEGSGYAIGRAALRAALQADDGRGGETSLLPRLLDELGLDVPSAIPPWVGRAAKAEVAALVPQVMSAAESGDGVARGIITAAARDLALHVAALVRRLGPWADPPAIVLLGGVFRNSIFRQRAARELSEYAPGCRVREPVADAVTGAVRFARSLIVS